MRILLKLNLKQSLFIAASIFLLSGCSDRPSNIETQHAINQFKNSLEYEDVILIRNVKKDNGYFQNDLYYLEVSYERHHIVGIDEAAVMLKDEIKSHKSDNIFEQLFVAGLMKLDNVAASMNKEMHKVKPKDELDKVAVKIAKKVSGDGVAKNILLAQYGNFSKGDVVKMTTTISLHKTDNGWRVYSF